MTLKTRTPCCHRLARFEAGRVAVTVADRTCPRCRGRWRVVITPIPHSRRDVAGIHRLEWTCTKAGRCSVGIVVRS